MKKILFLLLSIALVQTAKAQHTYQGYIEYERKTNIMRTIDNMDADRKEWVEKFKSQLPKFKINYYDLYFNTNKSIYKPGKEVEEGINMWFMRSPADANNVYTDFNTHRVTAQKQVYEEKFLVEDTMRRLEWKITDEVRTIANYTCRKAVGVMNDSVYVVAFYTDDIIASGGPEMFGGLPGMILELAIPRLHTTWIAQKIELIQPEEKEYKLPTKGKKVTQEEMFKIINTSLERWGKYADRAIWWSML